MASRKSTSFIPFLQSFFSLEHQGRLCHLKVKHLKARHIKGNIRMKKKIPFCLHTLHLRLCVFFFVVKGASGVMNGSTDKLLFWHSASSCACFLNIRWTRVHGLSVYTLACKALMGWFSSKVIHSSLKQYCERKLCFYFWDWINM